MRSQCWCLLCEGRWLLHQNTSVMSTCGDVKRGTSRIIYFNHESTISLSIIYRSQVQYISLSWKKSPGNLSTLLPQPLKSPQAGLYYTKHTSTFPKTNSSPRKNGSWETTFHFGDCFLFFGVAMLVLGRISHTTTLSPTIMVQWKEG